MSLTWTLEDIEAEVRKLTGKPGTTDLDQAEMWDRINDFYQNVFPGDIYVQELESWWTFDTAIDDDCEEALPYTVFTIEKPMTLKDSDGAISKVEFYVNKSTFFELYPEDTTDEEAERGTPAAALLYNRTVYLRPKADEVFTFKAASKIKPTALTAGATPTNVQWGPAIAQGTAVYLKNRDSNFEAALEKDTAYQRMITTINRPNLIQMTKNKRAMPRY
jgi:hypothetical protein